jgi:hypothetical protein
MREELDPPEVLLPPDTYRRIGKEVRENLGFNHETAHFVKLRGLTPEMLIFLRRAFKRLFPDNPYS